MNIFKFLNPVNPTLLQQGQLINDLKSKLWIERYRDFGDFKLIADADTMMHKFLPVGTLISHTETSEVMVVENHEIREDIGSPTEINITGRSFESFFENRTVGSNRAWPTVNSIELDYALMADYSWNQAVHLIQDHIYESMVIDPSDALPNVEVITTVSGVSVYPQRSIPRGSLYTRLIELLHVDDLGIKTVRPGVVSSLGPTNPNLGIIIHVGTDLTDSVTFSYVTGEIESAEYLWSNKKLKNAALVTGRWVETVVKDSSAGYLRRWMYVEAGDLDNIYPSAPTGEELTHVLSMLQTRGEAALAAQNELALIKAETNRNSIVYKYRTDYDVGDIVNVSGQYGETNFMRISEYVEIEDENGESGYPTLSAI